MFARTETTSGSKNRVAFRKKIVIIHNMKTKSQKLQPAIWESLKVVTSERNQLRLDCDNETKWAAHYLELFIANRDRADKAEEQFRILKETLDHVTNMYDAAMTRAERAEETLRLVRYSVEFNKRSQQSSF